MKKDELVAGLNDIVALAVKFSASNSAINETNDLIKRIYIIQQEIVKHLTEDEGSGL